MFIRGFGRNKTTGLKLLLCRIVPVKHCQLCLTQGVQPCHFLLPEDALRILGGRQFGAI
uniref:Uncharacterized protein n=1 Tax=Rubinisphaera brasiliensis (strain ATCC 49424 / DSM 5305 / JCM 21570 / IAM 15109 / NBRC 103401 / IFAM 1448) TaxID=756272 RepID=F0SR61_RUBBR|nr:hypothetical protein Plabr_3715 [Rubinisphaera brasiliensis DSM 5305]